MNTMRHEARCSEYWRGAAVAGVIALVAALLSACAGGPRGPSDRPLYYGYGTGTTATGALSAAKVDILTRVVPDLVGPASAAANRDRLGDLYAADRVNAYFYLDTTTIVTQGRHGDEYFSQIGIRVNLGALAASLRSLDVYGGQVTPSSADPLELADRDLPFRAADGAPTPSGTTPAPVSTATASRPVATASPAPEVRSGLSEEERAIVEEYLESITFMVYFVEEAPEDPFLMKAAVGMANGFLTERGREVVDLDIVERIKADEELVYEEQSGRSVSLIQWIARKLNADVYAELDARTSSEQDGRNYYGQANLTMKFFESSTGTLLASVNYKSPRTFSNSSALDAVKNALESSVYQAMPVAVSQIETVLRAGASEGIPYRLVLQNTSDARAVRDLSRKLEARVESIETVSQTREETEFRVAFLGEAEDLMDLIFDVTDGIPAFAGIELVMLRGRSVTFDTGW